MTLEQAKLGLKTERKNMRLACQTIARRTIALQRIRDSYGKHVAEHMPDDGGDAQPQPECYCPFCVSTRALQVNEMNSPLPFPPCPSISDSRL